MGWMTSEYSQILPAQVIDNQREIAVVETFRVICDITETVYSIEVFKGSSTEVSAWTF
jgi:hypothetical protein